MSQQIQTKTSIIQLFRKISDEHEVFQNSRKISTDEQIKQYCERQDLHFQLQIQFYRNQQVQIQMFLYTLKKQGKNEQIYCNFLTLMQDYLKKINQLLNDKTKKCQSCKKNYQVQLNKIQNQYEKASIIRQSYLCQLAKQYEEKCETIHFLNQKISNFQYQIKNLRQNQVDQICTKKTIHSNPQVNTFANQKVNFQITHKINKYSQIQNQKEAKKTLDLIKKIINKNYGQNSQISCISSRITDFVEVKDSIIRQSNQISHKRYFDFMQNKNVFYNQKKPEQQLMKVKTRIKKEFDKKENENIKQLQNISNFLNRRTIFSKNTLKNKQSKISLMSQCRKVSHIKSELI